MQWRICDQQAILEAPAADGWLVLGRGPEDCGQAPQWKGDRLMPRRRESTRNRDGARTTDRLNLERRVRQVFLREPGRPFDGDQVAAAAGVEQ
jgi:hypothetical protein